MKAAANWRIDPTQILGQAEIAEVLADLRRKGRRALGTRQNLTIFRLASCCGLRVSEICGLNVGDVRVGVARPYVQVRKAIAKGRRARRVPLWWDAGTLADLTAWRDERLVQGGKRLIFASTAPTPGWYSVDTAGTGKPTASMVMPAPFAVDGKGKVTGAVKSGWDTPPVVVHGHLVRRGDGHLEAFAVDGSNASKPVVLGKTTKGPWCADLQSGRVAFASAFAPGNTALKIVSARVDGSDGASPVPVMTLTMPNPGSP